MHENRGQSVQKCDFDTSRIETNERNERYEKSELMVMADQKQRSNNAEESHDFLDFTRLKKLLVEKSAEAEDLKRKLCDERVERKIANKKLECFETKIKELLCENEKLNQTLNQRLEHAFQKPTPKNGVDTHNDIRETMKSKEMENRVKALSQENERLFKENEELTFELKEIKSNENLNNGCAKNYIDAINREKEELKSQIKHMDLQSEQFKSQLEQYKIKAKDLETELLQSHVCISDLEKRLKMMMNQESLNSSMNNEKRGYEEEMRKLKMTLTRYRQEGAKIQEILENRRKELDVVRKELEKVKRENRKLMKMKIEWEETLENERKEKDDYKELIENQSVILREKELELDEKLLEIDEIRKGFLDLSSQQQGI